MFRTLQSSCVCDISVLPSGYIYDLIPDTYTIIGRICDLCKWVASSKKKKKKKKKKKSKE